MRRVTRLTAHPLRRALGANTTTYTDSGLSGSTAYYYRVYAYNGKGNSSYSSVVGAITLAAPLCTYSIAPTSASFDANANSGTVTVTATSGCAWIATTASSWIAI